MNCRQTCDLLSAYLDQELTGQQMLELRAHLGVCDSCAQAYREIREVRRLLRSLVPPLPGEDGERRLVARLDREALRETEPFSWAILGVGRATVPRWEFPARGQSPRPRGRRLASALALSSVAVLAVAAPVAPPTRDSAGHAVAQPVTEPVSASWVTFPTWNDNLFAPFRFLTAPAPPPVPAQAMAQQYVQPAAQDMDAEPFHDEAVSATLADYQSTAGPGR